MELPPPPVAHRATGLGPWPFGGRSPRTLVAATAHLLLGLPIGVASFTVVVTLGALALGLLVVYPLALPVLAAWVVVVHRAAGWERLRLWVLLRLTVPAPNGLAADGSAHSRLWAVLRHQTTWRAAGYHVLRLPLGVLTFTLAVAGWAVPVWLLVLPPSLLLLGASTSIPMVAQGVLAPLLGLALLPIVAEMIEALADLDAAIAAALLGAPAIDQRDHRIQRLHATRADLVDVADEERRRIERDLHDGAGQQLVSLAMTLGMAREKMRHDPASAQALIDEAHSEAKQALVGLREIVRGISPAILTDRGLGAALSAVAARASLPVDLRVDVPERPGPSTEGIAYYVVCEAISNAVRHADATAIRVDVRRRGEVLELEVHDDGHGGADARRGSGLRGLAARVAAVDGELEVSSPTGGPTVLRARLPVGSGDTTTAVR